MSGKGKGKKDNLLGKRFGRLIVIAAAPSRGTHACWECLCDCGTKKIFRAQNLKNGNTKSCGCLARECRSKDLTGQRFGKLTAIKKTGEVYKDGSIVWFCVCDCGDEIAVPSIRLLSGGTKSCGCLRKLPYGEAAFRSVYSKYKLNAKKKNIPFELTREEFKELTQQNCSYCASPPSNCLKRSGRNTGYYIYNGLDRIDNLKGYTKENVVPACIICNRAKAKMPLGKFLTWLKGVFKNYKNVEKYFGSK